MRTDGIPEKKTWIEVSLSIYKFHITKLKDNSSWRIEDTARELKRSLGAVSQYLAIASWFKTHENQLRRCDTMKEAVAFIKKHKRELMLKEIE